MIENKDLLAPRSVLQLSNMKKQMCSHKVALQMLGVWRPGSRLTVLLPSFSDLCDHLSKLISADLLISVWQCVNSLHLLVWKKL